MEKKKVIGVFAISLILLMSAGIVFAQPGFGFNSMSEEDKATFQEEREQLRYAIESEDFTAWKAIMEERIARMQKDLSEENFDELVIQHQEREEQRANGNFSMNGEGLRKGRGKMNGECPYAEEA